MTALARARVTGIQMALRTMYAPIAAGEKIYKGALCGWKNGYLYAWSNNDPDLAHPCIALPDLSDNPPTPLAETFTATSAVVDNTNGDDGDLVIAVDFLQEKILYPFINDTGSPITQAQIGGDAWGLDDQTVTAAPGTRSRVGTPWIIVATNSTMGYRPGIYVEFEGEAGGSSELGVSGSATVPLFHARNVVFANVADLTAYTVAASNTLNDNVLNDENDVVLLAGQTTAAQNGLYRVGVVTSGTAPLTRIDAMPAGATFAAGVEVAVEDGGVYARSKWFSSAANPWTVGTTDPAFYPETYKQTVTLAAGTYTIGAGSTATPDEPLFLLSGASVQCTLNTPGGTMGTNDIGAPSASRVTGKAGTAVVVVNSYVDAGTVAGSDTSTVDVLIRNR